jgi:putative transposase
MKIYRGFPQRLHHTVPHWVEPGALFHIRIALDRQKEQKALTDPALAQAILDSAKFYEAKMRWHITLFLLMPDHLHALLSFARDELMSEVIRDWKRFHARMNHVIWQEGYFDHRLRADERGTQFSAKMNYIRQNPVAAGLCAKAEDWPLGYRSIRTRGHTKLSAEPQFKLPTTRSTRRKKIKKVLTRFLHSD